MECLIDSMSQWGSASLKGLSSMVRNSIRTCWEELNSKSSVIVHLWCAHQQLLYLKQRSRQVIVEVYLQAKAKVVISQGTGLK